jgi:amino acid transporter
MEKETYTVDAPLYDDPARIVEDKGMRMGEAADVYGDIQTAEDYGYVSRVCFEELARPAQKFR